MTYSVSSCSRYSEFCVTLSMGGEGANSRGKQDGLTQYRAQGHSAVGFSGIWTCMQKSKSRLLVIIALFKTSTLFQALC